MLCATGGESLDQPSDGMLSRRQGCLEVTYLVHERKSTSNSIYRYRICVVRVKSPSTLQLVPEVLSRPEIGGKNSWQVFRTGPLWIPYR